MCDPMTSDNKKDKFNIEKPNKKIWKHVHNNNLWNDNVYPTTNAQAFYRYHLQPMIIDNSEPIKLLDVGCGTGKNAIFFAKNGCSTYGIDISEAALISADKKSILTNILKVGNAPGIKIMPGQLSYGLQMLAAGKEIDYDGGTDVEFNAFGDAFGAFLEQEVSGGAFTIVQLR